jgi:hypothetical protein
MNTYQLNVSFDQLLSILKQCSVSEKQQIITELLNENPRLKFALFMEKFNKEVLSDEEIKEEIDTVRQEHYEKGYHQIKQA